jgi:DNA helicase-2/ATP-dependent DNA helicase PcrA
MPLNTKEAGICMNQILDGLNEAQFKAVTHVDGPLLTLAGPGTGKTRVVTHRIAYMLEQGVSPYSILALTFTNKAAKEMKHRVAKIVGENPIWMGTFHGYCARFLRHYGNFVGLKDNYTIFDVDDAKKALEEAITLSGVSLRCSTNLPRMPVRWRFAKYIRSTRSTC